MKYKAVFFDFDGTLMDTSGGIIECGKLAMQALGLPIAPNTDWNKFIGPPLEQCFAITFGLSDKKTLEQLCAEYRKNYYVSGLYKSVFYEGIPQVLADLKDCGYFIGCATMKHEDLTRKMMDWFGISRYFDVVMGLDEQERNTKELLLREGCRRLGIKPCEAVLVGDTPIDANGAEKAGCAVIKVDWGFGFKKGESGTISRAHQILELV